MSMEFLKPQLHQHHHLHHKRRRWFLLLTFSLLLSTILILVSLASTSSSSLSRRSIRRAPDDAPLLEFVESKLSVSPVSSDPVPRLAYLISGSMGDGESLKRVLLALYHPRNQYVVHLDLEAPPEERLELQSFVARQPVFVEVGNVRMITKANLITYRGPTMVTNTLHAASILLKHGGDWMLPAVIEAGEILVHRKV